MLELTPLDKKGRTRRYISGHNSRVNNPRSNPNSWEIVKCLECTRGFSAYKVCHRQFCSLTCKASWLGRKSSNNIEYAEKMRQIALANGNKPPPHRGKDHWNWKGGITSEERLLRTRQEYIVWRRDVYRRDHFTCQRCGRMGKNLHAHHIQSFKGYPELRYDVSNGITLCGSCHLSLHGLASRRSPVA